MTASYEPEFMDQGQGYSLQEVCTRFGLESEFVIECVEIGITEIRGGAQSEAWLIPVSAIPRMQKAYRLQRDLELDITGLAVVLDLLDEIDRLNSEVEVLSSRLNEWES